MIRTTPAALLLGLLALATPLPCAAQETDPARLEGSPSAAQDAAMLLQVQLEAAARDRDAARAKEKAAREPPVYAAGDVAVQFVRAEHGQAGVLAEMLNRQAKRSFYVRSEDASVSGPYLNIDNFGGDVVMLHDHVSRMPGLVAAFEQIKAVSSAPADADQPLQALQYRPRNETVENLLRALEPFARQIPNAPVSKGPGSRDEATYVSNVTMLEDAGVLVLRDTPEHVAEMMDVLAQIDVPPPQVMLTCLLVQGSAAEDGTDVAAGLPDDLVKDLQQLLPVASLYRIGQAALRVAVVPGRDVVLSGTLETGDEFKLKLKPTGYDRERGTLSVQRCVLDISGRSLFDTSAALAAGENTVLGASGVEPLFVVLRVTPLDH